MRKLLLLPCLILLTLFADAQSQTQMPIPAHGSVFTGNIRGYWFTAPTCFTITGLRVPTEASTAGQTIAVVRFDGNTPPPLWSTTTDAFCVLYYQIDTITTDTLDVFIPVNSGEVIGILGWRGTSNSYAGAPYVSSIDGNAVTLTRLGMQYNLNTTAPQQLFQEGAGSLSRTEMYYDAAGTQVSIGTGFTVTNTGANTYDFTPDATMCNYTGFSYWDFGDGSNADTAAAPTHTFPGSGLYIVQHISNNACGDTIIQQISVGICAAPDAGFTSSVTNATATFVDTTTTNGAGSYFWDFGDGNTSTTQDPMHTYTVSGTYPVTQIVTDACGTDTMTGQVSICIDPVADFSFTQFDSVIITANNSIVDTAASYWWDFGNGDTDTAMAPNYVYPGPGTFVICLVASNICSADTICDTVTVCYPPIADFTAATTEGALNLTDLSTYPDNYTWDFGDGNTGSGATPSHTYSNGGTYTVCLTVDNACGTDSMCTTVNVTITGLTEWENEGVAVSVFPNPASTQATVSVNGTQLNESAVLVAFDAAGREVIRVNRTSLISFEVPVADLDAGSYLFHIMEDSELKAKGRFEVR